LEHVTRLPEVASAALTTTVPFRSSIATELRVEGVDSLPRFADGGPYISRVGPAYFTTLGMRAVRGRTINGRDASGAPPVAVVSETMARRVWSGRDPIGTCLFIGENATTCTRVVGIVNDARRQSFAPEDVALYYTPLAQDTVGAMRTLLVRVRGDARRAVIAVQRTMQNAEPALPFADVRLLQDLIDPQLRPFRLGATLFVVFGGVALLLAAVGLFSVVSYDTTQRTQEIGVRLALGAGRQRILRLVLLDGLRSAGLGALLGLAIAIASGRALASLLYNVSPRDPWILGTSVALLLLVAMIACLVPAVRATNVAPNHALRAE
jgi:predicted permease